MEQYFPAPAPSKTEFDTLNTQVQGLADQMENQIGSLSIKKYGILTGDVIAVANSLPLGISFYMNSNNPANCPTDCKWGAYVFFKVSNTSVTIFYTDFAHIASTYSLDPTAASSITWHIA